KRARTDLPSGRPRHRQLPQHPHQRIAEGIIVGSETHALSGSLIPNREFVNRLPAALLLPFEGKSRGQGPFLLSRKRVAGVSNTQLRSATSSYLPSSQMLLRILP